MVVGILATALPWGFARVVPSIGSVRACVGLWCALEACNESVGNVLPVPRSDRLIDAKRRRAGETAGIAVDAGLKRVAELIESCFDSALAPGTIRIYRRVQEDFLNFIAKFGVPVSALNKLRNVYVAHLIDKNKIRSLGCHVAALAHFFGPLPREDDEILRALVRGAKRTSPPAKHRKKATQKDVDAVISWALQRKTLAAIAGAAMILLAFAAFLRVGELCEIRVSDLSRKGENEWWLTIRKSKTDQERRGSEVAFRLTGPALILWSVFENFLPRNPDQYIFSRSSAHPPTRDTISRRIKRVLKDAGLEHRSCSALEDLPAIITLVGSSISFMASGHFQDCESISVS
ncbi:unnamed protein product [Cylicocyclus nassatus]|uniref:Tyr recombinase domain-containing protein n=1 Tax=Cylicocyclus nassatus TaxID=53992 RepID=A0AA36DNW9_CYLNA|nr:unnamed protein product [Cylicocyclus nassatus]